MSIPSVSQPAPSPVVRDGGRTALVAVGGVLAGLGALVAIAGVALLIVFGTDGRLSTGLHSVSTSTSAIVTGASRLENTTKATEVLGRTSVQLSSRADGGRGVFVGVARAADVDRYLSGAAVDEVTDLDVSPFRLTRHERPGTATPARPADQSFWVAKSTGATSAAIDWKVRDGDYRFVIMNADGSRQVATRSRIGVTAEDLPAISWTILGLGLVVMAGGGALVAVTLRRRP